ncbi:MAG: polysaccharide deacetylase family protein [Microlunatus sp.]
MVTARPTESQSASASAAPSTTTTTGPRPSSSSSARQSTKPSASKPKPKPSPKATKATKTTKAKHKKSSTTKKRHKDGGIVYLTFDDGPSSYTPEVLKVLRGTGSTATFFQLGVNRPGHEKTIAAIKAQGSNIANHTYSHLDLTRQSDAEVWRQLLLGPKAKCFRPPYGATSPGIRHTAQQFGMREVLWTVDTLDWQRPGVKKLEKFGKSKQIKDGSIILMHDGGGDRDQTVAALPKLIKTLQARGFTARALPYC